MKIGIITDIHSNSLALETVFKEFKERNIEKIICCGDIIGIGPRPEETMQIILKNKDKIICIKGNHEKYFTDGFPEFVHDNKRKFSQDEIEHQKFEQRKLSMESKQYIIGLENEKIVNIQGKKVFICHYPENEDGSYKEHIKNASLEEDIDRFSKIDANIFLYGHTHIRNINQDNEKMYINVGSLGCPLNSNIAKAGILTIDKENVDIKTLDIEYDVQKVIEDIKKIKYPASEMILRVFYGQI